MTLLDYIIANFSCNQPEFARHTGVSRQKANDLIFDGGLSLIIRSTARVEPFLSVVLPMHKSAAERKAAQPTSAKEHSAPPCIRSALHRDGRAKPKKVIPIN